MRTVTKEELAGAWKPGHVFTGDKVSQHAVDDPGFWLEMRLCGLNPKAEDQLVRAARVTRSAIQRITA